MHSSTTDTGLTEVMCVRVCGGLGGGRGGSFGRNIEHMGAEGGGTFKVTGTSPEIRLRWLCISLAALAAEKRSLAGYVCRHGHTRVHARLIPRVVVIAPHAYTVDIAPHAYTRA